MQPCKTNEGKSFLKFQFECCQLNKTRHAHNRVVSVLKDVSFRVAEEEFLCIVGPSGCGKTTLLKLIAGLSQPTSGKILFDSNGSSSIPHSAMVFQDHALLPWLTLADNIAFGLEMQGISKQTRAERTRDFIAQIGLAGFENCYPHQLSVGMRQRGAIARSFVADPDILLMDEPFSSLDAQTKIIMQEELLRIWRDHRKTVIYVTHDIEEAILLSDRVLVMTGRPGTIREEIPIPLDRPRDMFCKENTVVRNIKWHIWKMLEQEVRGSLRIEN